ncbi:lipase family protein [Plantactinospora sp. CA-290183]|uniref:lipase family protein n=1 Tax=Plantactinospora sp. CA-290183 TaxID=3240006 RepID=UPI003D89B11D
MTLPRHVRSAVILLAVLILTAAALLSVTGGAEAAARPRTPGALVSHRPAELAKPLRDIGAKGYHVTYWSTTAGGRPVRVTGLVIVPGGRGPAGGWPVLSWGHGTTGVDDACAPTRLDSFPYANHLSAFVRAGYAVAATDFQGLGTEGLHPYLIAEVEARNMIDAVRAARAVGSPLSRTWLANGHSQGGHAALATAEIAPTYAPELDFRGAVAQAPAYDVSPYVDTLGQILPEEQYFHLAMLIGLKTQYPHLRYADYLGPNARVLLPIVQKECVDEAIAKVVAAKVPPTEFVPRSARATERLRHWLDANGVPRARTQAPLLILQGEADTTVPVDATRDTARQACALGSTVELRTYPGQSHGGVLDAGLPDALDWLAKRRAGTPPPSTCGAATR